MNKYLTGASMVASLAVTWLVASRVTLGQQSPTGQATSEDFGFGNLPAGIGNKPLLLITWQLPAPSPSLAHANDYFDQLVFNFLKFPSVNGYFQENSRGRFLWTRAGVIGPVVLDDSEAAALNAKQSSDFSDGVPRRGIDSGAGVAYLLQLAATKTGYDFAQWDTNGDGVVDNSELFIMIIGNAGNLAGGNRPIGASFSGQAIAGQKITLSGKVAGLDHQTGLMTFAHEASHSLGTVDLYGGSSFSQYLTLMGATISQNVDDVQTFHLDPWHKMRLGWISPRIFTLGSGGTATVTTAQLASPNTPVILYDPARGTGEYFIVEFRNNNPRNGGGAYDASIPQANGLALWHVVPGGNPPVFHEGAPGLLKGGNVLWTGTTPRLRWNDGTLSYTRLKVLKTAPDGSEMVFEWVTRPEQFGLAVPGSVRAESPLVVLSRAPEQEEVFWNGASGDVSSVARNDSIDSGKWSAQFGLAVPGSVRAGSPLVVLSRAHNQEEVFWIGANGDVSSVARNDMANGGKWSTQFGLAVPGSVRAGSPLVVLSRAADQEEVFWIGANGDVSSVTRSDKLNGGRWSTQFGVAIPGSVRAGSPLVVLSRSANQEEIFWIGANGDVSSVARSDTLNGGKWSTQFGLAVPGSVRADSPLILLSRSPNQEEIFWLGANGDVSSAARSDATNGGKWSAQFGLAIPGSVRPGSPLVVRSRTSSQEGVFWIGASGDVSGVARSDGTDGGKWTRQFGLAVPGSVRADSPLVVISRTPEHEAVTWIGTNGDISSVARNDSIDSGKWSAQFGLAVPGSVRAGSPLVAHSRASDQEEVFWIGSNDDVSSVARSDSIDNGRWAKQIGLAVPGSVSAGSPLVLLSRAPNQEEVFWIGANGDLSSIVPTMSP